MLNECIRSYFFPSRAKETKKPKKKKKRLISGYCYMYAHELQMNPPSDKKITSKQKLVTINMQISCFMNTNAFFSSTNYIARPKQKICQTETLAQGACYAGYSYMYALQMNPLVTIMQILCFVNTHGFFSSTSYIKNPTHSHDLTCLFALL